MAIITARPTVIQRTQLGKESTYGTPVVASARMPALTIRPGAKAESMEYNTQGRSFASVVIPNREWVTATIEGPMTYSELPYLFCSLLKDTTPIAGAHSDYQWAIAPSLDSQDVPAVFTIEHGDDSSNGVRAAGGVVTDLTLDMSRMECKLTGTMLAQAFTTAFTLNGDAPTVENVPIEPSTVAWYLDPTFGAIGTTKLNRVLKSTVAITGRWQPEWVLDAVSGSYVQLVQAKPTANVQLVMEANSQAMGIFSQYRAGTIGYLSLLALGPVISTPDQYTLAINIPVEIKQPLEFTDEGGVYAIGWDFAPIDDATAGYPINVAIQNKLAHL